VFFTDSRPSVEGAVLGATAARESGGRASLERRRRRRAGGRRAGGAVARAKPAEDIVDEARARGEMAEAPRKIGERVARRVVT
jgi:hypothetical protein